MLRFLRFRSKKYMMSAQDIMYKFEASQGWNDSTQLALLLEYVDNQSDGNGFREFLQSFIDESHEE